MFIKKVYIYNYKLFKNFNIDLEKNTISNIFSIASVNGGGKSIFLQLIFIMLHCFKDEKKYQYIKNLLSDVLLTLNKTEIIDFCINHDNFDYDLKFYISKEAYNKDDTVIIPNVMNDNMHNLYIETNFNDELLNLLSKRVFLNAPIYQIFHFIKKKMVIFQQNNIEGMSYFNKIDSSKKDLSNFFTYEYFSQEIILKAIYKALAKDKKRELQKQEDLNYYNQIKEDLENFFEDKKIIINDDIDDIIFIDKFSKKKILHENFSHGELRKLSMFIWIKYFVDEDSIILMDEIDIGLHPKWQYELVDELEMWSSNSQFFLATHSPQILSSTYYKNLILLDKNDESTKVHQLQQPIRDNDVNSVVELIMGAKNLPQELDRLQKKYRELVEKSEDETIKARGIKEKILQWETINSSFFRRIDFYKKMKR
jgi:predicted ATPase